MIGNKKFAAHVNSSTEITTIIHNLRKIIDEQNIEPIELYPIIYNIGDFYTCISMKKVINIYESINIPSENCTIKHVNICERITM